MAPDAQTEWLDRCEANRWSVQEFRQAIRDAGKNGDKPQEPAWTVEPDVQRVVELSRRLIHEAQPNGDGRWLVDGEVIEQLRAQFGEGE